MPSTYDAASDVTSDNVDQYLYDGEGRVWRLAHPEPS